ncbi:hypothetical protein NEOLI_001967 [Neolecta irregularis DAH-3]|uniref:Uncharacterized protein n=1 Tax=Neolecta irregularis (strain DAH-3) TaxID=1198029 RepID=A0A1U7LLF0_NEOID|nr:hypothetical protein NEOLI_001967 [Neolecta irregularis DAH-3]|eukprot:OLL23458.1 hypothetical protein NEOLI_001967 [Neolecta irregularis DAH-3]
MYAGANDRFGDRSTFGISRAEITPTNDDNENDPKNGITSLIRVLFALHVTDRREFETTTFNFKLINDLMKAVLISVYRNNQRSEVSYSLFNSMGNRHFPTSMIDIVTKDEK